METSNSEDATELEAQLYGQIQHGSTSESIVPNALCTKQKFPKLRYWDGGRPCWGKKGINPFAEFPRVKNDKIKKDELQSKRELQLYKPYSPLLSNCVDTPEAIENPPKIRAPPEKETRKTSGDKTGPSKALKRFMPFNRNEKLAKLTKVMKYQLKKVKAAQAKEKRKNVDIETIVLPSSEDEDDVVEIPLPAPPTVTIDSSEESDGTIDPFLKPLNKCKITAKTGSRCASPSSVVSDDFIGQIDRSRLLEQKDVADDEDLLYLQETVDTFLCKSNSNSTPLHTNNQASCFVAPKKCNKVVKNPDYNVPHSNFRATDVYESESSDMPDCDLEAICLQHQNCSESDTIEINDRTKKRTKRRKSGNIRESIPNVSSDSEEESHRKVSLPYISRGEAVEEKKGNVAKKFVHISEEGNGSDNEFISLLRTISQPLATRRTSNGSDKSAYSSKLEDISARKIAEDVLLKESKGSNNSKSTDALEKGDAIPATEDIDKLFDSIDKIHTSVESVNTSNIEESEQVEELEYIGEEGILCLTDSIKQTSMHVPENTDNGLHIVFTHGKNVGWTEEMIRFYSWSWGQENYNVRDIRKMMNVSSNWRICTQDRFPRVPHFKKLKCFNCFEFGHIRSKCPQPRKELVCCMCGEKGHSEPRCPNTICLRCGKKTNVFTRCCNMCSHENRLICPICKIRGHSIQLCPDKWRRYHSTTEPNDYPNKKHGSNERIYCCICARQGHLSDNCKSALKFSQYPPSISEIKSYAKAYDDDLIKFPFGRNNTGYALLSRPCENVLFKISSKVTTKQCYGRFLNAVSLDYLMAWNKRNQQHLKHKNNCEHVEGEPGYKIAKQNYVVNPFAQSLKTNKVHDKKSSTPKECENISNEKEIVQTLNESVETSFEDKSQSKETTEESGIAYNVFSEKINNNQSTPNLPKKCRKLESLPEFIPLNLSSNEMEDVAGDNTTGISKNFQPNTNWKEDNIDNKNNTPCEAKLYLTKIHSTFLLSTEGNKFLTENCRKYSLKTKIEWTSVGNALIIKGLPSDQDNFRNELLAIIRKLSDQTNRQELEKIQRVPKKRDTLIKFLQQHLLQLENDLGSVIDLYKRLQTVQNQQTKNGFKTAEKIRRVLNMILIGQTGLKEGKESLQEIFKKIKILQENTYMDIVPDNMRDEIYEHWKHIFSSQQHENYDDLIQQYLDLKRNNELPKVDLDRSLLGGRKLEVSLTDEEKQKLNTGSLLCTDMKSVPQTEDSIPHQKEVRLEKQSFAHIQTRNLNFKIQGKGFRQRSFIPEQMQEVNKGWRNRCRTSINRLDEPHRRWIPTNFQEQETLKAPSIYWSRESMKFIEKCLAMNPSSLPIISKLEKVQEKARQGLLSHNDFRAILQIHNALQRAFK